MQRLEPKASLCAPYTDKHDILVEHLALAIQIRKDMVQSLLPLIPKFPRDKSCSVKLLDMIMSVSDNAEKIILAETQKAQDVFILPRY